jgi:hypothetical protein
MITLQIKDNRQLYVVDGDSETAVIPRRCFPWQHPEGFIALMDKEKKEVALVRSLDELDADSHAALRQMLDLMGFTLQITQIHSIVKEIEIRNWKVETNQGSRTFQTELDEWPRKISGDRYLIRDVCGDLYSVDNEADMDKKSRDLLWRLLE